MKFIVSRDFGGRIKISRLIEVYKECIEMDEEGSLDINFFQYDDSWDNILIEKNSDKITVEFILAIFSKNFCKRLTVNTILSNRNNFMKGRYDTNEKNYFNNYHCIRQSSDYDITADIQLQEIDVPIDKLVFDKNELTKRGYIIQLSLLTLNK